MHGFASGSVDTINDDYLIGADGENSCYCAISLVCLIAIFDDVVQSGLQFGVVGEPFVELAFVEVTRCKVEVFNHEVGQVFKGVCRLMF